MNISRIKTLENMSDVHKLSIRRLKLFNMGLIPS